MLCTIKWNSRGTASFRRCCLPCKGTFGTKEYRRPEAICATPLTKARFEVEDWRWFLSRGLALKEELLFLLAISTLSTGNTAIICRERLQQYEKSLVKRERT